MNKKKAKLKFEPNSFSILENGDHVVCAVSKKIIPLEKLSYWNVTGGTPPGDIISFKKTNDLIESAERGVRRLFESFLGRETPFYACPDPLVIPAYHDYAHLERIKEWG